MSKLAAKNSPTSLKRLRRRIGSWDNLTTLEVAARLESFTKAALELGISQPAISRRIRDLEERLGVLLFERNGKRLQVTDVGASLQSALARAFADIDLHLENIMRKTPEGVTLRITPSASGWILPALGALCNAFPEIPVNLVCLDFRADPTATEFDLQLCFMAPAKANPKHILMLPGEVLQVASPEFAASHQLEPSKTKLLQMERPFTQALNWRAWRPHDCGHMNIITYPSHAASLEAALCGRGIALGWRYSVGPHIQAGRLICMSKEIRQSEFSEYLITSPNREADPAVQKIVGWLSAYANALQLRYRDL